MKKISLISLLLLSVFKMYAQPKIFGREPDMFLKEMGSFLKDEKNDQIDLDFLAFEKNFKTAFDEVQQQKIIKASNEFLKKKFRANPEFHLFIKLMNVFAEKNLVATNFKEWLPLMESKFSRPGKENFEFILASYNLLNGGVLYQTSARLWRVTNPQVKFKVVNGKNVAEIGKTDLKCITAGDSIEIFNTQGSFNLDDMQWDGKSGKVTWERVNIDKGKVFVELKKYNVDLTKNFYEADSVLYTHTDYFGAPLLGNFEDKALVVIDSSSATYPRFYSYNKKMQIDKLANGIDYNGGFSHQGKKIVAYGDEKNLATFKFYYEKKLTLLAEGTEFIIDEGQQIKSIKAGITLYLDTNGKITHPQASFIYVQKNKTVTISRSDNPFSRAPFVDNYHQLEIAADLIQWKIDEPKVEIKMIVRAEPVVFHSNNYFRDYKYDKIQGILDLNPLQKIKSFCDQNKTRKFTLEEYAKFVNSQVKYVSNLFIMLHDDAFLDYDPKTQSVEIYDKVYNYVNAHMSRIDNDIISFQSIIEAIPNATINLVNFHLNVEGVPALRFSDSQNVFILPYEQKLTVRKNRDLEFGGMMRAGRFEFFGKNFDFNYNRFTVDMSDIDSLRFFVPDERNRLRKVNSVLQDLSGTLFIDQSYNKSGRKDFPEYPIFKATKGSKVYYDQPSTFGGVYNREKFYFDVLPFTIDSLDNFSVENLKFDGTMVSGGIFEDFEEQLTVQEDFSLGFKRFKEAPMYGGKGNSSLSLALSNQGFFGTGEIKYASSLTKSKKFTLFIDSTVGYSENFTQTQTGTQPDAVGNNVYTKWVPALDKMSQFTLEEPIKIYGNAEFRGEYIVSTKANNGNGMISFNDGELISNNLKFLPTRMTADTSTLTIKSIDTTRFAFRASNIKANVDMTKRVGDFKANSDSASSEFPYNAFKCSLNEFKWDIAAKNLKFVTPPNKPKEKSYFVSTNIAQDSLKFVSTDADYSLVDYIILANKVPEVKTSDALVIPFEGKVVVRENGNMDTLKNSIVLLDSATKYHKLYACNIKINTRHKFGGNGKYDYVLKGGKKFVVEIDSIDADERIGHAYAFGQVGPTDDFVLHPKIDFWGGIVLTGAKKEVYLDGFVLAAHALPRERMHAGFYRHKDYVNKDSLWFGFADAKNADQKEMFSGLYLASDTSIIYPILFDRKRNYSDVPLVGIEKGIFYYDDVKKLYVMGDSNKILNDAETGNYMTVDDVSGQVIAEGKLDLGLQTDELKFKAAGYAIQTMEGENVETAIEAAFTLDFPFPSDAMKLMTKFVEEYLSTNDLVDLTGESTNKAIAELVSSDKELQKVKRQIKEKNSIEESNDLMKTFFIPSAQFIYTPSRRSYICDGYVMLNSIDKSVIGKKVYAKIEIEKKRSGDEITFYLDLGGQQYIYFNYFRKIMYFYTTSEEVMLKYREGSDKASTNDFRLRMSTEQGIRKFLRTFDAR